MAPKRGSRKISSVKRSNQLRTKLSKQGKLKKRHHKKKSRKPNKSKPVIDVPRQTNGSDEEEDEHNVMDMVEEDDVSFLQNAVSKKSYSFLKGIRMNDANEKRKRKRKSEDEEENIEEQYAESVRQPEVKKKYLLPIKTTEGIVIRTEDLEDENELEDNKEEEEVSTIKKEEIEEEEEPEEISVAEMLARRQLALQKKKFRIGVLCSGLLENPETKIANFGPLLEMLNEKDAEACLTSRKLVLVSLFEVFKDLLPAYRIKHNVNENVRLKKVTKQLHEFESKLLKAYKTYLQRLEGIISILKKKKGDTRVYKEPEIKLAELSMKCLCDLLVAHPYFNFAENIVHLLIPYLDCNKENIRHLIADCFKEIFKTDKKGDLSLNVVRGINKFVKSRSNLPHPECILIFLHLKLKDVNLDQEKESEMKEKKFLSKKHKVLRMTKREKKRNKRIQELEKELLETKAQENVQARQECLTEITKLVFTIYFRILKQNPNSKLLNAALEGLAKFAHCINLEFYEDLINVLDNIIENENIGYKEKLFCVQTVFTVLSYQGATINIDPHRFYRHLYTNMFQISAGKTHTDLPVILKASEAVLIKRRKQISMQRLLAFIKRMSTLALQVLPNGSLGLLCLIKQILQVNNSTDVLLDNDDSSLGQGIFLPEIEEPEYCNANATLLWELLPLQRHYHPTVQEYSRSILNVNKNGKVPTFKEVFKLNPEQLYNEYDASEVKFNPPVPPPAKFPKKKLTILGIMNDDLETYVKSVLPEYELELRDNIG